MSKVSDAIDKAREKVAAKADKFSPRTCSIVKNSLTDGGAAGDTLTPDDGPTGIPYKYKVAGPKAEVVVGGEARSLSHWLTMPHTDDVLAIKPEDRIVDDADAALVFQEPVVVYDSMSVFVKVAAMMVQQGYN